MRTIEQSLRKQKNGAKIWSILLCVSILSVLSPTVADSLISFEASMAAAFVGLVMTIISIVMIRVYNKRKEFIASLLDKQSMLDAWECSDRYEENKGLPIQAYFSVQGVFYAGKPYTLKSYECVIIDAKLIDDEGTALSITYTIPNSSSGARRHKNAIHIPVPAGKEESAKKIAGYYARG